MKHYKSVMESTNSYIYDDGGMYYPYETKYMLTFYHAQKPQGSKSNQEKQNVKIGNICFPKGNSKIVKW